MRCPVSAIYQFQQKSRIAHAPAWLYNMQHFDYVTDYRWIGVQKCCMSVMEEPCRYWNILRITLRMSRNWFDGLREIQRSILFVVQSCYYMYKGMQHFHPEQWAQRFRYTQYACSIFFKFTSPERYQDSVLARKLFKYEKYSSLVLGRNACPNSIPSRAVGRFFKQSITHALCVHWLNVLRCVDRFNALLCLWIEIVFSDAHMLTSDRICFSFSYGYKVTICESHYLAGGAAHSFERDGFLFDSGPSFYSGISKFPSVNPLGQVCCSCRFHCVINLPVRPW